MRLLLCLAEQAGTVVSIEDLLNQVWSDVTVSPDSVYQAVASLRRQLGDEPRQPKYIATVPRLGYRMVAAVSEDAGDSSPGDVHAWSSAGIATRGVGRIGGIGIAVSVVLGFVLIAAYLYFGRTNSSVQPASAASPQQSIAVLPFLDLTPGMKEEEFADGMTEELIDQFSKIPGLRVPSPTSVFYFKDKKIPVGEIAKKLGVAYVLDGSVRKSGERMRIAARLIRAENGYVIWSESYDRAFDDRLKLQDDVASDVTKVLKASIETTP